MDLETARVAGWVLPNAEMHALAEVAQRRGLSLSAYLQTPEGEGAFTAQQRSAQLRLGVIRPDPSL